MVITLLHVVICVLQVRLVREHTNDRHDNNNVDRNIEADHVEGVMTTQSKRNDQCACVNVIGAHVRRYLTIRCSACQLPLYRKDAFHRETFR